MGGNWASRGTSHLVTEGQMIPTPLLCAISFLAGLPEAAMILQAGL